ncbi:MAG TPA: deoxyuridine 5'-triphosphate nucleotidohydrolase [Vicinamibacteria bacterium]|nr:deoxyuridine 5'-triphosphate nucleotidohydrolase [Vicinamibacteria bacterium]
MKLVEGAALRERLSAVPPLVDHLVDPETQIQMNGVDFTLREVSRFGDDPGVIDFDNSGRCIPSTQAIPPDESSCWRLRPGPYWIVYNEVVNVPADMFGLARTRSSVLRCGAQIGTALWDSGYSGRSGSLLVVHNPAGIVLKRNARVLQLVFFALDLPAEKSYAGRYQNENK